jgi:hypothetical protein
MARPSRFDRFIGFMVEINEFVRQKMFEPGERKNIKI